MGKSRAPQSNNSFFTSVLIGSVVLVVYLIFFSGITVNVSIVKENDTSSFSSSSLSSSNIKSNFDSLSKRYIGFTPLKHDVVRPPIVPEPVTEDKLEYRSLYDMIKYWSPDDPTVPSDYREVLQNFDFGNPYERSLAEKYRDAEIPFKLHNITEVDYVTQLWQPEYLAKKLDPFARRTHVEKSKNNHFLYWSARNKDMEGYTPPTELVKDMTYSQWKKIADAGTAHEIKHDEVHYYFMANTNDEDTTLTFIADDLPMLSTKENNFFIKNVKGRKGIQCRFGMRGVIAESHFDAGRNMVVMLKGNKRYVLNPPRACPKLALVTDKKHPSYRQSVLDWSDPNMALSHGFDTVDTVDTIVHEGEVLYIPSFWFHYIVSLDYSIQCNARSGIPKEDYGKSDVERCIGGPAAGPTEVDGSYGSRMKSGRGGKPKPGPGGEGMGGGGGGGGGKRKPKPHPQGEGGPPDEERGGPGGGGGKRKPKPHPGEGGPEDRERGPPRGEGGGFGGPPEGGRGPRGLAGGGGEGGRRRERGGPEGGGGGGGGASSAWEMLKPDVGQLPNRGEH